MITIRQALKELLQEEPLSALELSQRLSIPEKEVYEHLQHLARAPGPGFRFHLIPRQLPQMRLHLRQAGAPHHPFPLSGLPAPIHQAPPLRPGGPLTEGGH